MRRTLAIGALCCLLAPDVAQANGRTPLTLTLHVRPGNDDHLLLTATWGLAVSTDGGDNWYWICESAIGYGGTWDPDVVFTTTGSIFAHTYNGLQVSRDHCVFDDAATGDDVFISQIALGPDGAVHAAATYAGDPMGMPPEPADYAVHKSTDDGVSFPVSAMPGTGGETWTSLEVAPGPGDGMRVYLTGYRLMGGMRTHLLYTSTDGGASYQPQSVAAFTFDAMSKLQIIAISPDDPDRVLARVTQYNNTLASAIWLSENGGVSWTNAINLTDEATAALFRANGDAVVATAQSGLYVSTNGGASFAPVDSGTVVDFQCLREIAGEVWACTQFYVTGFGVMRSADLANWTGVMGWNDIVGPLDCPAGTIQTDCCVNDELSCAIENAPLWCIVCLQLGRTDCPACPTGAPDAAMEGVVKPPETCCSATEPTSAMLLGFVVFAGLRRRRRPS
jgi:uncharacterized protein (TIGR03382 family)